LKQKITTQLVLALPRREGKFRVEVNASGHTIRGVLLQEQEGKWKLVVFLSRTMSPAEKNYEIYDKELLAIVKALDKCRQYVTVVLWTSSHILYSLPLHQKGDISKATC